MDLCILIALLCLIWWLKVKLIAVRLILFLLGLTTVYIGTIFVCFGIPDYESWTSGFRLFYLAESLVVAGSFLIPTVGMKL